MKLKSLKPDETRAAIAAALDGLQFDVDSNDGNVTGVRIGNLHIGHNGYGAGFKVSRVVNYDEAERYRVRVDHPNFASLNKYFETSSEAREFARPFEEMADTTVQNDSVTVHIDDSGKVIAEVEGEKVRPLAKQDNGGDDLPF